MAITLLQYPKTLNHQRKLPKYWSCPKFRRIEEGDISKN
jgi:hypothetical protein